MAEQLFTMNDLLMHELSDLYSAENQLIEALPLLAKSANSPKLRQAIEDHLTVTRAQLTRLNECFTILGQTPANTVCAAMKGLIAEGQKLLATQKWADPSVYDAALIAACQRVEHYEMAGYGCARTYAMHLGEDKVQQLLQQTLDEEGATDHALTKLAETDINYRADQAGMEMGAQ
jgi:ferritin-like metal-binding protein YciE